jgi:hypothetical protein
MLTVGELGWWYTVLCYFCTLSVNLKLSQNKKVEQWFLGYEVVNVF